MRVLTLFLVRAACTYLSPRRTPCASTTNRLSNNIIMYAHQPSLTISYPSNNLSLLRLLSRVTGWLLLTLILIATTASSLDYFYFYLPPKQHYFLVRIGVIFLESLVSGYFYFFEPSQQPLWKTKQYDIGINRLGQLLGLP